MAIHRGNWNFSYYRLAGLKGFISLSAEPGPSVGEASLVYSVTVAEDGGADILQKDFAGLSQACHFINGRYGHWEFVDQALNPSRGGGCSTCQAKGENP